MTVYSVNKPSLLSPILANGSSLTKISVVRFEVGSAYRLKQKQWKRDFLNYLYYTSTIQHKHDQSPS